MNADRRLSAPGERSSWCMMVASFTLPKPHSRARSSMSAGLPMARPVRGEWPKLGERCAPAALPTSAPYAEPRSLRFEAFQSVLAPREWLATLCVQCPAAAEKDAEASIEWRWVVGSARELDAWQLTLGLTDDRRGCHCDDSACLRGRKRSSAAQRRSASLKVCTVGNCGPIIPVLLCRQASNPSPVQPHVTHPNRQLLWKRKRLRHEQHARQEQVGASGGRT